MTVSMRSPNPNPNPNLNLNPNPNPNPNPGPHLPRLHHGVEEQLRLIALEVVRAFAARERVERGRAPGRGRPVDAPSLAARRLDEEHVLLGRGWGRGWGEGGGGGETFSSNPNPNANPSPSPSPGPSPGPSPKP